MQRTILSLILVVFLFPACNVLKDSMVFEEEIPSWQERTAFVDRGTGCYEKALIQDYYETVTEDINVYTGDEENVALYTSTIDKETSPATTKWIKKKADKNCLSPNPDDCIVWCKVEVPAQYRKYVIVDTTKTNDFKVETLERRQLKYLGGYTEEVEVICQEDISPGFVFRLHTALSNEGFYDGDLESPITKESKEALVMYQAHKKELDLPVGQMDTATLEALGVY